MAEDVPSPELSTRPTAIRFHLKRLVSSAQDRGRVCPQTKVSMSVAQPSAMANHTKVGGTEGAEERRLMDVAAGYAFADAAKNLVGDHPGDFGEVDGVL